MSVRFGEACAQAAGRMEWALLFVNQRAAVGWAFFFCPAERDGVREGAAEDY